MLEIAVRDRVALSADRKARTWLDAHPEVSRLFLAFMSSRACCSGARVCDVRVRVDLDTSEQAIDPATWSSLDRVEGRDVYIDGRLIERMPAQGRLTVRGLGPFRRLDLALTAEQWAELLYPAPR
jgi:hypothetical protein